MIAFDDTVGFELVDAIANGAGGDACRVSDVLCRGIAGVPLKEVEDASVNVVQVTSHVMSYCTDDTNAFPRH